MTFGDSTAYWAPEPLPVCDSCGPGMVLIVNGSEPAKHRLQPHTRARHSSWRACASDALHKLREWHQSSLRSLKRSSATQVHQQGIQCERTLCVRRGQVAEHGRTPAVAARMPPTVLLVINLRIGTPAGSSSRPAAAAAACCCLIQSSQRRSEACRNRVVLSLLRLERIQAHQHRSWMVPRVSLRRGVLAMAGLRSVRWKAERATKQRKNHASDGCHKTSDLAHPGLDLIRHAAALRCPEHTCERPWSYLVVHSPDISLRETAAPSMSSHRRCRWAKAATVEPAARAGVHSRSQSMPMGGLDQA